MPATFSGLTTYTTTCGEERVSFQSCRAFVVGFEALYDGRNQTAFPMPNPMRSDPRTPVGDGGAGGILFPVSYKFEQDIHGVANLAFPQISATSTSGMHIEVAGKSMCLDSGFGGSNPGTIYVNPGCVDNSNQQFYYDPDTYQIMQDTSFGTRCLDANEGGNVVYLNENCQAVLNQKWRYNALTLELSTFQDAKCLTDTDGTVSMQDCNGDEGQRFHIPGTWFQMGISFNELHQVRVVAAMSMCMTSQGTDNVASMSDCKPNVEMGDQYFSYDVSTHQIKQGQSDSTLCLDSSNGGYVVVRACDYESQTQMWRYDRASEALMTFYGGRYCLDWDSGDSSLSLKPCTDGSNQQFVIPYQWGTVIETTSILSSVMIFINGQKYCMDGGRSDGNLYMNSGCDNTNPNENFSYNATSRQIMNEGKCLDATDGNGYNAYMNDCNDGQFQQWHYESSSRQLRHLASDRCLDSNSVQNGGIMTMNNCNNGDYQQFYIPLTWLPAVYLGRVRVVENGSKCIEKKPNSNNNVWMGNCTDDLSQVFTFEPRTLAIKHIDGTCIDYDNSNNNVFLNSNCDVRLSQQWYYASSSMALQNNGAGGGMCLDWNSADSANNLYMHSCDGADNQKWMMPTHWLPAIVSGVRYGAPSTWGDGYIARPIPTGLWNGQWNAEKGDNCPIDLMKDVLDACDDSMALLLGDSTSVGILRQIAQQVKENGPDYMPGTCCLDNPYNSEWFGYYYATSVSYYGSPMECQNNGPWHLGISVEACTSAGGHWFQGPCLTLQKCINDRPKVNETGYTTSFEEFAQDLVILDAWDQDQCSNSRQGLGFEADYPFDTEVCEAFIEQECSEFYNDVDGLEGDWSDKGTSALKPGQGTPWNAPIQYTKIDDNGSGINPDFHTSNNVGSKDDILKNLKRSLAAANALAFAAKLSWKFWNAKPKCIEKHNKDIEESEVCVTIKFPNPEYIICMLGHGTRNKFQKAFLYGTKAAQRAIFLVYSRLSIHPWDAWNEYYYVQNTNNNLANFQGWTAAALRTINENVPYELTQVRDELIEYICATVEGMGATCVPGSDPSSRLLSDEVDADETKPVITWGDGKLSEKVNRVVKMVKEVHDAVVVPGAKSEKSQQAENEKEYLFAEDDEEEADTHLSASSDYGRKLLKGREIKDDETQTVEAITGKVGEVISSKVEALKVEMDKSISSLEAKVDTLSNMMAQLIDQNKKLLETETTLNDE
ncbi:hypothetical protein ACHAWF_015217 [Thalassiosira exigua]